MDGRGRVRTAARRVLGWPARAVLDPRFQGLARQFEEEYLDLRRRLDELRVHAPAPDSQGGPAALTPEPPRPPQEPDALLGERFEREGFCVLRGVLTPAECAAFLDAARRDLEPPLDWDKGRAATSRVFYELATHPPILDRVCELLGPDVLLWGASIVERPPGTVHAWHTDIESSPPDGRTATVWLGLEHTTAGSSLSVVTGSHRFGRTIQEEAARRGRRRGEYSAEDVERWLREERPESRVVLAAAGDGDAVVFDGRLWHGSENAGERTRTAVLLQYATPETPIRHPDFNQLEWPFRWLEEPLPPCLLVRGEAPVGRNRVVPAPPAPSEQLPPRLTARIQRLPDPLVPGEDGWRPYPLFRGACSDVVELGCHVSALAPGRSPHEPHRHPEEELLLVVDGEADLVLPELPSADGGSRHRVRSGRLAYYPPGFPHTLEAAGERPAAYLMLKWRAPATAAGDALGPGIFDLEPPERAGGGGIARLVFEGATRWLRKLHCHVTTLAPGDGYEPHLDAYAVVIVTLEGEVETLGHAVGPRHVIVYGAGQPHGMRCVGEGPARYVVFELHGSQNGLAERLAVAAVGPA